MIEIGRVSAARGIRGEVKFFVSGGAGLLQAGSVLNANGRDYTVESVRGAGNPVIVKLGGVDTRNDAELLKGAVFFGEERADSGGGRDFTGLAVTDAETGETIGRVKEVLRYPAQDILLVEAEGREFMLPNVGEFVKSVDETGIRVKLIEGIL